MKADLLYYNGRNFELEYVLVKFTGWMHGKHIIHLDFNSRVKFFAFKHWLELDYNKEHTFDYMCLYTGGHENFYKITKPIVKMFLEMVVVIDYANHVVRHVDEDIL